MSQASSTRVIEAMAIPPEPTADWIAVVAALESRLGSVASQSQAWVSR
jgi:hypothetical protein